MRKSDSLQINYKGKFEEKGVWKELDACEINIDNYIKVTVPDVDYAPMSFLSSRGPLIPPNYTNYCHAVGGRSELEGK